jgi:hypothetical protein
MDMDKICDKQAAYCRGKKSRHRMCTGHPTVGLVIFCDDHDLAIAKKDVPLGYSGILLFNCQQLLLAAGLAPGHLDQEGQLI